MNEILAKPMRPETLKALVDTHKKKSNRVTRLKSFFTGAPSWPYIPETKQQTGGI